MRSTRWLTLATTLLVVASPLAQQAPAPVVVRAIRPPASPLPPESASANVRRFAFIAYGDTRGPADGLIVQPQHAAVVDAMLRAMPAEQTAGFPVRFVIQSGDAVIDGIEGEQWNISYIPIIERITREAGLPYFFGVGNHDMGARPAGDPDREARYRNAASANAMLWPADGAHKLAGYPAYSFGYGQYFFITFDSDIPEDQTQLKWVTDQLEHLDRARFPYVVAFFHHPPLTSGPHGASAVERESEGVRHYYLPLFRKHHVRMTITGHDHLYDHWIEHYDDASGTHRMDHVVTGGGGAPIYTNRGEQDQARYIASAAPQHVTVQHAAKPGVELADNPHHFLIFEVDGEKLWERWVSIDAAPFMPFGRARVELADAR